ncbi:MAG: hypothetical protein LBH44_09050 [Treponema sp.]|nr:hypothetical protein [Treponema sp.]
MNMIRFFFFGLALISLFSCGVKKDTVGYRMEQDNNGFHSVKLFDKNNIERVSINFSSDGAIISYSINDSNNFSTTANLLEDDIKSYSIEAGNKHLNSTIYNVDDELLILRREQVDENITYEERIYKNGLIIKEKGTDFIDSWAEKLIIRE